MEALPDFTLADYASTLDALRASGYAVRPVSTLPSSTDGPTLYLRHDVDFHLGRIVEMGELEAASGVAATYYVALTQPYNVLSEASRSTLRALVSLGHEIGLHYDLMTYPANPDEWQDHLAWELSVLERVAERPVQTLCMHQPFLGTPDPFRELDGLVHPHDPRLQEGLVYVSDSCRAWRDDTLLRCLSGDVPRKLLLNTHPELWLGEAGLSREAYLHRVLDHATEEHRTYLQEEVAEVWRTHEGPIRHDARERQLAATD